MKTVIYHSADYDGIFCREIAKRFLGPGNADDPNQYIGWNFGDPKIRVEPRPDRMLYVDHCGKFLGRTDCIYVMDLSPECLEATDWDGWMNRVIWIDHHKTSIDKYPSTIPGYRIDGVAACRLAWQWFMHSEIPGEINPEVDLPPKDWFIERKVLEPVAVQLAGEYDIWDHEKSRGADIAFQFGLRAQESLDWAMLLSSDSLSEQRTWRIVGDGQIAQRYSNDVDASICKSLTWLMEWEGLKFLCVNHARFNSLLFAAKDVPETGHDALLGFRFDGKQWMVSMYHAAHRKDLDLSEIAKKHGGGGHRGACGFVCKTLPFPL